MKQIGKEWRKLSPEEKEKYEDLAKKDRERYLDEVLSMPP
jgi:hypothetical protein